MQKSLYGCAGPLDTPVHSPVRELAARALRRASRMLTRLARQISLRQRHVPAQRMPELEFYAEAGAPEGALYLDGELVGHLPGVTRL